MSLHTYIKFNLSQQANINETDYFHVSIVGMIQVDNNTESQLDELLSRKERKWIWDLCSLWPKPG